MSLIQVGSTRFVRMEALFHEALALPARERESFLAGACGDDVGLLATLLQMLSHETEGATGLGASIGAIAADWSTPADRSGERIGPYRLSARIRYGGMAEVYAADRADGEFEQAVAIKIARSDRPRLGMTALFQAERGVLARLRHPNICQFLDGGSTPEGEPYFVMERLSGVPLTTACRAQDLPWREVLAHFLDLCAAVAHIHGQLIVHRDIKPDNVLMATGPTGLTVKLIDFGIAGLLAQDGPGVTGQSGKWYSPDYAAPEVVAGQVGGVAVDIYSLGCLLRDLAPLFPAARRGEIAAIAAHAGAADPAARYASVEALAADLRCVRDRHPISLRRQASYRLRCFVQRHAIGLGVAAVALGLIGLTLWREVHLRQAAEIATATALKERDKAGAIRDFLLQAYDAANPALNAGSDPKVTDLLEQQAAALAQNRTLADDARIDLLGTLARAMMNLGRFEATEQTLTRALALVDARGERGSSRWARLVVQQGENAQRLDQFDRAEALFRTVDAPDQPWQTSAEKPEIAAALYSAWAVVAQRLNRLDDAESLIRRALDQRRQLAATRNHAPETAGLLVTLGAIQSARNDLSAALATFEQAHAENLAQDRRNSFPHLALLGWIGITLDRLSRPEQAEPYLREAVTVAEQLFPEPHPKLSGAYGNLGSMYLVNGRFADAQPWLQRGLDVLIAMGDQDSAVYQTRLHNLGRLALEREDLAMAAPKLEESLRLRRATVGDRHERTAVALLALANLSLLQAQPRQAIAHATEALGITRDPAAAAQSLQPGALIALAEAHAALGQVPQAQARLAEFDAASTRMTQRQRGPWRLQEGHARLALGDLDGARRTYLDAIDAYGGDACSHPACAQAELRLARIATDRGDLAEARTRHARAVPVLSAALVPDAPTLRLLATLAQRL